MMEKTNLSMVVKVVDSVQCSIGGNGDDDDALLQDLDVRCLFQPMTEIRLVLSCSTNHHRIGNLSL